MHDTKHTKIYRIALSIGLITTFVLLWANGAVGIIGSENNPANLLYMIVFFIVIIGSIVFRFKPHGMARTFFVTAVIQFLIPLFALFVWPAKTSWGAAGVIGVLMFNFIFVLLFLVSGLLCRYTKNHYIAK